MGLDCRFLDILNSLQDGLNFRFRRITAVGGGIRNRFWVRNRADMTGLSVETSDGKKRRSWGRRCRPAFYAERFPAYRKLFPALRPVHHALFQLRSNSSGGVG